MFSRIAYGVAVVGLGLSMVGVGAAAAAPIAGTGTVGTCTLTGKAKIKPALVFGGTSTPVTTKFTGTLSNCSGGTNDGASVIGGKVKGVITSTSPNDCAGLAVNGLAAFSLTTKWKTAKGGPKLLPSTTNFAPTPPGSIVIGTAITITLSGTNASGTSFAGNSVTANAITDELATAFATACMGKGLKQFHFTGVNGTSTITE